jgi:hypothetical protein
MNHPVRSDFDTAVTEAGVNVTFKPTNSIYSFYRLAESEDVARLGPVSKGSVRHGNALAGVRDAPTGNTARPISLASVPQRIASEVAATLWLIQNPEAD